MILDGKALAAKIRADVKQQVLQIKSHCGVVPKLCVVMVGDYAPSKVYVRNKLLACQEVGIEAVQVLLPKETTESQLMEKIEQLNHDSTIDGVLVQFPLPSHLSQKRVLENLSYKKDVDGFTYSNLGRLLAGEQFVAPCTPSGIIRLLDEYQIPLSGKTAIVVGRSLIVGKPMAELLTQRNATVTLAHSKTQDLASLSRQADICIFAAHQNQFFGRDFIKKGAVVVDVGIHSNPNGKISGDTKFDELKDWASYITPVPGGVGPLTIAMLLSNTVTLFNHFRFQHAYG